MAGVEAPQHLSPSGFATWRQCPAKYWHTYLEDHPRQPATLQMVRGTFVHLVMERLLWLPAEHRTPEAALDIARRTWISWRDLGASAEFTALGLDDEATDRAAAWTWTSVLRALSIVEVQSVDLVATELRLEMDLGGVPFKGFVDLVTRDSVDDYKTGEKPDTSTPWAADSIREKLAQPLLYAAALDQLGLRVAEARLIFVPAEGRAGILSEPVTLDSIGAVVAELADTWAEILEAVDYDGAHVGTKPSPLCGWCDFLAICPDGQAEVKVRISLGRNVPPAARAIVEPA